MPTINQFATTTLGILASTSQQLISYDVGITLITTIQNGIMIGLILGLLTRVTWWVWK